MEIDHVFEHGWTCHHALMGSPGAEQRATPWVHGVASNHGSWSKNVVNSYSPKLIWFINTWSPLKIAWCIVMWFVIHTNCGNPHAWHWQHHHFDRYSLCIKVSELAGPKLILKDFLNMKKKKNLLARKENLLARLNFWWPRASGRRLMRRL